MSTLYVDRKNMELRTSGGALEFYESDGKRGSVPLAQLERVVFRGQVRLSTSVLGALAESGVGVLSLSGRHNRHLSTMVGRPHNDVVRRIGQFDAYLDRSARVEWSRDIVQKKIYSQRRFLQKALTQRPDKRFLLTRGIKHLDGILQQVSVTGNSMDIGGLRGLEGAAAASYFKGFCTLFPPSVSFTGRNRRPPRDPVNACLSLGYTLLHFEAVINCHEVGLDPLLGMFHEPAYGRESLAADMIEPLRAHIDEWVWELFRTRTLDVRSFKRDGDTVLLGKNARHTFYSHYRLLNQALTRLLRRQMRVVAKQFEERGQDTQHSIS